jgi:hypothetical protein
MSFSTKAFVEDAHQRHAFLDLLALEAQRERDTAAMERLIPGRGINAEGKDLFRRGGGDLFDVHAALGGAHEGNATGDSGEAFVDPLAGVDEALHGRDRVVEHRLLVLGQLDVDDPLDAAGADDVGTPTYMSFSPNSPSQ